jgi:hypothetical protein
LAERRFDLAVINLAQSIRSNQSKVCIAGPILKDSYFAGFYNEERLAEALLTVHSWQEFACDFVDLC